MPFTPFHFGPGAALHSVAPKQVSLLGFCSANVFIDFESLYNLIHQRYPVHALLHTCIGATLIVAATVLLFMLCRWFASRFWLPDLFGWRQLNDRQVLFGAALGAYSHLVLDSLMHDDIRPLAPFSDANPLLNLIPLGALHIACIASGILGAIIVVGRWYICGNEDARQRVG